MSNNQQSKPVVVAATKVAPVEVNNELAQGAVDTAIGINGSDDAGTETTPPAAANVVLNAPVEVKAAPVKTLAEKIAVAPKPFVPAEEARGGVVVENRGAVPVEQTPEFVEAMDVVKSQTKSALYQVLAYCDAMAPGKPQTEKSIQQQQLGLLSNLFTILNAEDKNFPVAYRALLSIVNANKKGAFRVESRARGLNTVAIETIDNKQMRFLTRIVDLLCVNAGINDVDLVKQHINIPRVLESVYNVRIKQNLTQYYSV